MVAKVGISIAQGCTIEAAWQSKLFYSSQNMFGIDDASVSWKQKNRCARVAKVGISIAQGCTIKAAWQS